jgi:hypothetical protein
MMNGLIFRIKNDYNFLVEKNPINLHIIQFLPLPRKSN